MSDFENPLLDTPFKHEAGDCWTRTDDPGEPTTDRPRVSVSKVEASVLRSFARQRDVLEIGTGIGVSTTALSDSADSVVTHDIDPWVHEHVWPTLDDAVVRAATRGEIVERGGGFDLVFIDGDHQPESVFADVEFARDLLRPWGLIVVHDAAYAHVAKALDECAPGWVWLQTFHGMGLIFVDD